MKYLFLIIFLAGCASSQQVKPHSRDEASARQYCYNVSWSMFPGYNRHDAFEREQEYERCLNELDE